MAKRPPSGPEPDPARLDEEYRALQASLEEYLERRVEGLRGPTAGSGAGSGAVGGSWWDRYRPEVYFGVVLVLLALLWWRMPSAVPVPAEETVARASSEEGTPPPPPPTTQYAPPIATTSPTVEDPAADWEGFLVDDKSRAVAWTRAVAEAKGLPDGSVSDLQRSKFGDYADLVAAGTAEGRTAELVRLGLFESVWGRYAAAQSPPPSGTRRVDLVVNDDEYPAEAFGRLVRELALAERFPDADPSDPALQTAIVLAWTASREP